MTRIVYKATPPTLTSGDVVIPLADSTGALVVTSSGGSGATATKQDDQTTLLTSIAGHVDTVEAKLDTLHTDLTGTLETIISVDPPAESIIVPTVAATSHVIGDVVGGVIEITGLASAVGRYVTLHSISLTWATALQPNCRVVVFSETPATSPVADDGVFAVAAGDMAKWVDTYSISCTADFGTPKAGRATNIGQIIKCGSASTSIFLYVVTDTTITTTVGGLTVHVTAYKH